MALQADLVLMHAMLPDAPQLLQPIVQYGRRLVCLQQLLDWSDKNSTRKHVCTIDLLVVP